MKRIVLITGSTRGIGFSTAAGFLRQGDRVAILCRHRRHVTDAVRDLSSIENTEDVLGLVGDVRKPPDVADMMGQCLNHYGRLDILVNNAIRIIIHDQQFIRRLRSGCLG